jgi:hypothetical protein
MRYEQPFPHVVLDGHWDAGLLERVADEFPDVDDEQWRRFRNVERENKLEGPARMWGPAAWELYELLRGDKWIEKLSTWFNIDGLECEAEGGGYHLIPPGGHLSIHVDFNQSARSGLWRRLNCLIYLNHDWQDVGGKLWMGKDAVKMIAPEFNRTVCFATSDESWHGHPVPATRLRRSFATYYFAPDPPVGRIQKHGTVWA